MGGQDFKWQDHEQRLTRLESQVKRLLEQLTAGAPAVAAPPGPGAAPQPYPSAGQEIRRLNEEVRRLGEALAAAQAQAAERPDPWAQLVAEVKAQARKAAAATCDGLRAQRLGPRRPELEAQHERLSRLEAQVTALRDAVQAALSHDRAALEPVSTAVMGLRNAIAGARELTAQALGRQADAALPEPELPEPTWTGQPLLVGAAPRLDLAEYVLAWETAVNTALEAYYAQCVQAVEAAEGPLDQQLGKGLGMQLQDRVITLYTTVYAACGQAPRLQPLEPMARALVEALGLTVVSPQVGRSYDVYTQDFLDNDPNSELPAGMVSRVVEPGYKKDGKLLIKPKVLVSGKRA